MISPSIAVDSIYTAIPLVAAGIAAIRVRRRRNFTPVRDLLLTSISGAVGGLGLVLLYRHIGIRHVSFTQIATACYWGVAVACVLKAFGSILAWSVDRAIPTKSDGRPCCPAAEVASTFFRAAVLLGVTIPYVGAMVLTYRLHDVHPGTPTSILGLPYQDVTFDSTDGMRLRGWWIPAAKPAPGNDALLQAGFGDRTVILCHGFAEDKASALHLASGLAPSGYNVLVFDFRAHGQSSGQLTTFGDLERNDVLGAVRWLRTNHPLQARKIFGLGESLGAAALIAAAGENTAEGQAIDAIAVFSPYDSLASLIQDAAESHFAPAAGWMAIHLALPVAGAQMGTRLQHFSPEIEVEKFAPRPILVIGSEHDRNTSVALSKELYEQASQPKYCYWIQKKGRSSMLFSNDQVSAAVRVFFKTARNIL